MDSKIPTEEEIIKAWEGDISKPLVSIECITYNHELYIKDAINGFLIQKTNFPFEIIIYDDASTDNTQKIINDYKRKYPKIIKTILQKENQYQKGKNFRHFILDKLKGKYVAICEGDDYWTDPNKLMKQVNFLENNPQYIATAHNVRTIDENYKLVDEKINPWKKLPNHVFTFKDGESMKLAGQTASLVYRNIWKNLSNELISDYLNIKSNGDRKLSALLSYFGDIYFFSDTMANYRRITSFGDSWSARTHGKNLSLHYYNSVLEINKFFKENFNISLNNKKERLEIIFNAYVLFIKQPNKENFEIIKKIMKIKKENSIEIIIFSISKIFRYPIKKIMYFIKGLRK